MDIYTLVILLVLVVGLVVLIVTVSKNNESSTPASAPGEAPPVTVAKDQASQMVQDIKFVKTSRVADEIAILNDLGSNNLNFRQYCELVGTSQADGGVTAPYSQRKVAYYDIRCYSITTVNGRDEETLVAHETSIEPFYFTDASSDTPVYVDVASFGARRLLVNSCNHIEGPGSDFSKAFSSKMSGQGQTPSGQGSPVTACVSRAVGAFGRVLTVVPRVAVWAVAAAWARVRQAVACACQAFARTFDAAVPASWKLAPAGPGGGFGGPGGGFGGPGGGFGGPGMGGPGGGWGGMSQGLGDFLGGFGGQPRGNYHGDNDAADVLVGMGLGMLVGSLAQGNGGGVQTSPSSSFRGYRLVEDVVPLNSPVYCIGEIYRNGTQIYMGASTSDQYPTSFFATKPESEVVAHLSRQ